MSPFICHRADLRVPPRVRMAVRTVVIAALSPLLEKNVLKTVALDVPVVFSMSRVIVLAFAVGMLRQLWFAGIAGWPDATLAIAVVLALPILGALERVDPAQVVELAKALLGRFGAGDVRSAASVYAKESSSHVDRREDA
jgi:hypothetical protein